MSESSANRSTLLTEAASAPIANDNLGGTEQIVTTAPGLAGLEPRHRTPPLGWR